MRKSTTRRSWKSPINVNGLFIGTRYTKAKVKAKFGTPAFYSNSQSEFGADEKYCYGDNRDNCFTFSDNGIFVEFSITDPKYVVQVVSDFKFKPCDNDSKFDKYKINGTLLLNKDGYFRLPIGDYAEVHIKIVNGMIERIYYSEPL